MARHYLLTLYRSLTRHRLYAALNVLGLAVGIAVFLVLFLDVRFETSFERWIPNASQLYSIRTGWAGMLGGLPEGNGTMGGLLDQLRQDYPQIVGARMWDKGVTVRQGASASPEQAEVVDPNFLQVFDLPLLAGDRRLALSRPDGLLLTEAMAQRYFGAASALGRPLTLVLQGTPRIYRVTGVLKTPPKTTDLKFDFVIPLTPEMTQAETYWRHWGSMQVVTYLRFADPGQARALRADMDRFIDRHGTADIGPNPHKMIQLKPTPLPALHLYEAKDRAVIIGLGAVGGLTLLLAMVNYVNLATARGGLRAREVAVRKVMGATGGDLLVQFMAESLAIAALALLIGLALCELALPLLNAGAGLALTLSYVGEDSVVPLGVAVVLGVGVCAGAYPALVLSRFRPAAVLASARTPGGGRAGSRLREALVCLQFAIAITFTIATGVILAQTHRLRTADLGFQRHGLIVVDSFDADDVTAAQRHNLLQAWRSLPGIVDVTAADIAPGNEDNTNASNTMRPGVPGNGPTINYVQTAPDFFRTYAPRLLAGRLLDQDHGGDVAVPDPKPAPPKSWRRANRNVVLNASAARTLGFASAADAIGKPLEEGHTPMTVVGVVADIRFRSPQAAVPPTLYLLRADDFDNAVAGLRYQAADPLAVMSRVKAAWTRLAPGVPFRAKTSEDNLAHYYTASDQHGRLFTLGAVLAVLIGCVGLYGLAAFATARRTKEIGIRKTLGASTRDVLSLLIAQFLRPVLLANLFAWPLAYLAMRNWLSGFDQRIGLGPSYFLAATLLSLAIAGMTVAGQALRVARAEPARALRHE